MYPHIEEVKEVVVEQANDLLKRGWQIINTYTAKYKIGETDKKEPIYSEKLMYGMGRVKPSPGD
jgi:hypothetical protein